MRIREWWARAMLCVLAMGLLGAGAARAGTGSITGTVIDVTTGTPLAGLTVRVAGTAYASADTDTAGLYTIGGLGAGTYYAYTDNALGFINQAYKDVTCLGCNAATAGEPIVVADAAAVTGIDFALRPGARISGLITDEATGAPVPYGDVIVVDQGNRRVAFGLVDAQGRYTIRGGVPPGTYFARTNVFPAAYIDELYDNLPCLGDCVATVGTPLVLTTGTLSGIDFALHKGATIEGRITSTVDGAPLPGVRVSVVTDGGFIVGQAFSGPDGGFKSSGLPTGSYYARTGNSIGFLEELYDDIPCTGNCDPRTGTAIDVLEGVATTGIDFALDKGASITGRVTDAATGNPIAGLTVHLYDQHGKQASAVTDATGAYVPFSGLRPGRYHVWTGGLPGYFDEAWGGIHCAGSCTSAGQIVTVGSGQTVSGIDIPLDRGAAISGRVRDAASGQGLPDIGVEIITGDGIEVAFGLTNGSGAYTTTALFPGIYYAHTISNQMGYLAQLYSGLPCVGNCQPDGGTPIAVPAGPGVGGIDFGLERGGTVTGRVTDAASGQPLAHVSILISGPSGFSEAITDGGGSYRSEESLDTGTYYAQTANVIGYVNQHFGGAPCVANCGLTGGASFTVQAGQTTSGIDFALSVGGRISGTATDATTGMPLPAVSLVILDASAAQVSVGATDGRGHYLTGAGLPSGTYYARTWNREYVDQLYAGIPCGQCPLTSGTPIPVTVGATTGGIDFAMQKAGSIAGTIRDGSGQPLERVAVIAVANFNYWYASTDATGRYIISDLPEGSYVVKTNNTDGYVDEAWVDVPCGTFCSDVAAATPVPVTLGLTTSGIDFVLRPGARITGTVTDRGTGLPLAGSLVTVFAADGSNVTNSVTDVQGRYLTVTGLLPGSYYLVAGSNGYLEELYGGGVCPGRQCAVTAGTAVAVTAGATTSGIDLALDHGGRISGSVVDATTGGPIAAVLIGIFDTAGRQLETGRTQADGTYLSYAGLLPGTYYARTVRAPGHVDELYGGKPCPMTCLVTDGTAITVTGTQTTSNVDFTLDAGGRIGGHVFDAQTSIPLERVSLNIVDGSGRLMSQAVTDSDGAYVSTDGLPAGSYYIYTRNSLGYQDQLFDGRPYPQVLLTSGTPIMVAAGASADGIDFRLPRGGRIAGTLVDAVTGGAVPYASVSVYDTSGRLAGSGFTDVRGRYVTRSGLAAGDYYVRSTAKGYVDQVYGIGDCLLCQVTTGALVGVSVAATTSGIDFSLHAGSSVSGRVTGRSGGAGLPNIGVLVYESSALVIVASATTDGTGAYRTAARLTAGTYFVRTANDKGYVDSVYDGLSCPPTCRPNDGTPVALSASATRTGIDFVLDLDTDPDGDGISTTVDRDRVTGADQSTLVSSDFNDAPLGGATAGTITDRGGFALTIGHDGHGGVHTKVSGTGTGPARLDTCFAGGAETVSLDVAGEQAYIVCSGTTTTVLAEQALPVIELSSVGLGVVVELPTGQRASLGSPVTASESNTLPIRGRLFDGEGKTVARFVLDPGDSLDASVGLAGTAKVTVVAGTVALRAGGEPFVLDQGQSRTIVFETPLQVLQRLDARVSAMLAAGDIRKRHAAKVLHLTIVEAEDKLADPAAERLVLETLLAEIKKFKQEGKIRPEAVRELHRSVVALIARLG